jgi:hypothetical protein
MNPVTGTTKTELAFALTGSGWLAGQSQSVQPPTPCVASYSAGSGAGQVAGIYAATLTLAGAPTTLDLTALLDPLGGAVALARVVEFYVKNNATTDGWVVRIGPGGTNGWAGPGQFFAAGSPPVAVGPSTPGSVPCAGKLNFAAPHATGYPVDATHRTIVLDPGAHTFTVDILIVGS